MWLGFALGVLIGLLGGALRWRRGAYHAETDALTGIATRRAADAALQTLRPGDAVVMLDVDGLKVVNDERGHAAGDHLLTALANHLTAALRAEDAVMRWGGDEFMIVLRQSGEAAAQVVDRLRASSPAIFSAGIAVHGGGPGTETLTRADAALLSAKRAGGSRVAAS